MAESTKKTKATSTRIPKKIGMEIGIKKSSKIEKIKPKISLIERAKKILKKKKTTQKKIEIVEIKKPKILKRSYNNPILTPSNYPNWESQATFNPSAIYHDGIIHIVYRAVGVGDNSVVGYANSTDGVHITERLDMPIFRHEIKNKNKTINPLDYISGGGGSGGCEDQRLTLIGSKIFMMYTAFDGWGSVRIGMTSISLNDFINKNFNWKEPVLISMPGEIQKNWVLFPEKIRGKYAIMHSISPEIMIDYIDDMDELDGERYIKSIHQHHPLWQMRDRGIRGVGPSPIKTKDGWLVLYHGMEDLDPNRYKLYAMLLDLKDPTKIIAKSKESVLEPDEQYENEGLKAGVVYSCGAVIKDDELFVYYGGADMVVCVAKANLELFLKELMKQGSPKLITKKKRKK